METLFAMSSNFNQICSPINDDLLKKYCFHISMMISGQDLQERSLALDLLEAKFCLSAGTLA